MYGLKALPFREASFSAACEAVPFAYRLTNLKSAKCRHPIAGLRKPSLPPVLFSLYFTYNLNHTVVKFWPGIIDRHITAELSVMANLPWRP
jgi:hypothetical protein